MYHPTFLALNQKEGLISAYRMNDRELQRVNFSYCSVLDTNGPTQTVHSSYNIKILYNNKCLEVIKAEFSLKLKIKLNDWLLVDTCSWLCM